VFESLPDNRIAKDVAAPATEPSEVNVGRSVVEIEWTTDKRPSAILCPLPETGKNVGGFTDGGFRGAGEVDASEEEGASVGVDKVAVDGVNEVRRGGVSGRGGD